MPMSRLLSIPSLVFALMLAAPMVQADTPVTYTENGRALFSFEAPDFWSVRVGGPRDLSDPKIEQSRGVSRLIGLHPVSEPHLWVGFISPEGVRDFADAREYLRDIGPFLVKDAKIDKRAKRVIGGRSAQTLAGHGKRDGKSVNFTAVAIDLPNNRVAISVVVMDAGLDPESLADVNRMFASFRAGR